MRGGVPVFALPGAALGSLAARFCWQGQHLRLWTVPERVSGPPPLLLPGAALWTVPERVSGRPPLMLPGAALGSLAPRFCWQGQHLDAHTFAHGARASHTRHTQHFRLWTVPERVSGAPPPLMLPGAALGQGQHFRLWTVPERVSGPLP